MITMTGQGAAVFAHGGKSYAAANGLLTCPPELEAQAMRHGFRKLSAGELVALANARDAVGRDAEVPEAGTQVPVGKDGEPEQVLGAAEKGEPETPAAEDPLRPPVVAAAGLPEEHPQVAETAALAGKAEDQATQRKAAEIAEQNDPKSSGAAA